MADAAELEFEVWPGKREVTRTVCRFRDKKEREELGLTGVVMEQVTKVEEGFMVYFAKGHSCWYDAKGLRNAGLDRPANMVDMETGETVGLAPTGLKTLRGRSLARNGKSRSGGIELQLSDLMNSKFVSIGDTVNEAIAEEKSK